jgi:hypothetical protein
VANTFFTPFLNGLLSQAAPIDFDTDNIVLALVDNAGADGAPSAAMDFWDDLDGSIVDSLSSNLGTKTIGTLAVGVFDAADMAPAFTTVSGATVESLVMLKTTGTPSTSPMICWWDTTTGLPLTPNGGDVNVVFHGSGIIKV